MEGSKEDIEARKVNCFSRWPPEIVKGMISINDEDKATPSTHYLNPPLSTGLGDLEDLDLEQQQLIFPMLRIFAALAHEGLLRSHLAAQIYAALTAKGVCPEVNSAPFCSCQRRRGATTPACRTIKPFGSSRLRWRSEPSVSRPQT